MANMSPAGTRTLLGNSGNFIANLLRWGGSSGGMGGLDPEVIVKAINGPVGNPGQNVLRKVKFYGRTAIDLGWPFSLGDANVQFTGARKNTQAGVPNFDRDNPW